VSTGGIGLQSRTVVYRPSRSAGLATLRYQYLIPAKVFGAESLRGRAARGAGAPGTSHPDSTWAPGPSSRNNRTADAPARIAYAVISMENPHAAGRP
jgi:hypothetical protein